MGSWKRRTRKDADTNLDANSNSGHVITTWICLWCLSAGVACRCTMCEGRAQYEDLCDTPDEQVVGFKSVGSTLPGSKQL